MWRDCDGNELSIGDRVTLVGPIAGRDVLGRSKHGAVVGFGRINVQVIIDEAAGIMAGERVAVAPHNLRHGHHGHQRFEDQLQSLADQHAKARLVELLGIGQQRGIVTPEQADQLLDVWQQIAFPMAPDGAHG